MRRKKLNSLVSLLDAFGKDVSGEGVSSDMVECSFDDGRGIVGRVHSNTVKGRAKDLSCMMKFETINMPILRKSI